jgi:hypothetical protein
MTDGVMSASWASFLWKRTSPRRNFVLKNDGDGPADLIQYPIAQLPLCDGKRSKSGVKPRQKGRLSPEKCAVQGFSPAFRKMSSPDAIAFSASDRNGV